MARQTLLLIITGDDRCFERVKDLTGRHGIDIVRASDGEDIGEQIARKNPQAVLLDVDSCPLANDTIAKIRGMDPHLPIISLLEAGDDIARVESLKRGAYASLEKPLCDEETAYHLINNAVEGYLESRETSQALADMKHRCEADRLNLLELELVKSLQHMIGETEDPVSIFKNSFTLIKNYLTFDVFAALAPRRDQVEIYVYPNVPVKEDTAETIIGTLIKKMAKLSEEERRITVRMEAKIPEGKPASHDLTSVIVPLSTSNGTYGYCALYRSNAFDYQEESVFKKFCSHIANALEKISLFEEVKTLSTNDGLTGLYNHLFIVSRLDHELQRSRRYGSPLSIIIFDVDDFKAVNDTHGHLAGDSVLSEVAGRLQKGVRSIDSVGRYGGEEFLVILPETEGDTATIIADRLRDAVSSQAFDYENAAITVSVSGGVAAFREDRDAEKMIRIADENLYSAKKQGKNVVRYDKS